MWGHYPQGGVEDRRPPGPEAHVQAQLVGQHVVVLVS